MSIFGFSFGKKKSSGSTNTDLTKNTATTQAGSQLGAEYTASQGSSQTQQSATGSSATQTGSASTQTQTGTGTSNTTQTGTTLDAGVLAAGNEGAVSLLNKILGDNGAHDYLTKGIDSLGGAFDINSFIENGMKAAQNRETNTLDATINQITNAIGAGVDENSQSALLAQKANLDANDRLAGIYAQLNAQGESIKNERLAATSGAVGQDTNLLNTILQGLKGGATTGAATTQEATQQATQQAGTGTSATQTAEQQQSSTLTQQMQEVLSAIQSLMSGTENTLATEDSKTKGKQSGFGASLSL